MKNNASLNLYKKGLVRVLGRSGALAAFLMAGSLAWAQTFTETMGTVGSTTSISTYEAANGFDNDALTMSGTGDVRSTLPSSGYSGASGGANIFITNTPGTNFQIAGINTSSLTGISLSFGIHKSTTASSGADLIVEYSTNGSTYTTLSFPSLPSGTGTATWYNRTVSSTIPASSNLFIRFRQAGNTTQYRIDDVKLSGTSSTTVSIAPAGPTTFCAGGSVTLNATTSSPHAVTWFKDGSIYTTGLSLVVTESGIYQAKLMNLVGVFFAQSTTVTVTVNPIPDATVTASGPITFCEGGSVTLTAAETGASYNWSNGSSSRSITVGYSDDFSVTVTKNACSSTSGVTSVTVNDNPNPSISYSGDPVICSGSSISLSTEAYASYSWSNGATTQSTDITSGGVYSVSVTDANGCSGSASSDNFYVRALPHITAGADATICDGNSVDLNAAIVVEDLFFSEYVEGSGNNKYIEIYNGTASSIDLSDYRLRTYNNGNSVPNFDNLLSGILAPGQTVVYENQFAFLYTGTSSAQSAVIFNGNDAVALYKVSTAQNIDIIGRIGNDPGTEWTSGSHSTLNQTLRRKASIYSGVNSNPSGTGSGAFITLALDWDSYPMDDVSGLGSHTLTGTFTWSPATGLSSATGAGVSASPASTTTYTVSGSFACSNTDDVTVTVNENPTATATAGVIACNGGSTSVLLEATGGLAPYTGTGSYTVSAGSYTYTVTDANGCSSSPVSVSVSEPAVLEASSTAGTIACNGGTTTVNVTATGGTAPYTGTGSYNVGAGSYTYTVTDANGCTANTSVSITEPSALIASTGSVATSSVNTCAFGTDANIVIGYGSGSTSANLTASASGGTGAYSYSWSPASGLTGANTANATFTPNLTSGCQSYDFTLTVSDANGCTASATSTVKVVNVLAPAATKGNAPRKVLVCHRTNGSNETVNIEVSENAVAAHLAHGDCLGGCNTSCGTSNKSLLKTASIEEHEGTFTLYPNPNDGVFVVELDDVNMDMPVVVTVYDLNGKALISQSQQADATHYHVTLDLNTVSSTVANGLYLVQVSNGITQYLNKIQVLK